MKQQKTLSIIWKGYDYIFYITYLMGTKLLLNVSFYKPEEVAVYVLSLTEGLYLVLISNYLISKGLVEQMSGVESSILFIAFAVIMVLFNSNRFAEKDKHLLIVNSFEDEKLFVKIFGRIICGVLLLLPWIIRGYRIYSHK